MWCIECQWVQHCWDFCQTKLSAHRNVLESILHEGSNHFWTLVSGPSDIQAFAITQHGSHSKSMSRTRLSFFSIGVILHLQNVSVQDYLARAALNQLSCHRIQVENLPSPERCRRHRLCKALDTKTWNGLHVLELDPVTKISVWPTRLHFLFSFWKREKKRFKGEGRKLTDLLTHGTRQHHSAGNWNVSKTVTKGNDGNRQTGDWVAVSHNLKCVLLRLEDKFSIHP